MSEPWVALVCEIVRGTPRLPDAACLGRHALWEDPNAADAAIAICNRCPALDACQARAAQQHRLFGVVAGQPYEPAAEGNTRRRYLKGTPCRRNS